jgi:hypothetical protein
MDGKDMFSARYPTREPGLDRWIFLPDNSNNDEGLKSDIDNDSFRQV